MDTDSIRNRWRVLWIVLWVLSAPFTWIGPFIFIAIVLILIGGGTDPSGRTSAFGAPLMAYYILGLPLYVIVVLTLSIRGKLRGTHRYKPA